MIPLPACLLNVVKLTLPRQIIYAMAYLTVATVGEGESHPTGRVALFLGQTISGRLSLSRKEDLPVILIILVRLRVHSF